MNGPLAEQGWGWTDTVSLLVLAATLAPWVWIVRRLMARRPVLPYQPRRPVPWSALDVVLVVCFFFGVFGLVLLCERPLLEGWAEASYAGRLAPKDLEQLRGAHSLLIVLAADPHLPTLAICFFSAVVVAPIAEEFFFRLLLQGWLEKLERRLRRPVPALRRLAPGVLPIVIASVIFAALHSRAARPEDAAPDVVGTFHGIVAGGVAYLLVVVFGAILLRNRTAATSADLGFVPGKFWRDVRLGLVAALAVIPPLLLLQVWLGRLVYSEPVQDVLQRLNMPTQVAVDPIPIFLLAVVLGTLYYRTHRIVPGITLHMALNLTSLTLAWLSRPT